MLQKKAVQQELGLELEPEPEEDMLHIDQKQHEVGTMIAVRFLGIGELLGQSGVSEQKNMLEVLHLEEEAGILDSRQVGVVDILDLQQAGVVADIRDKQPVGQEHTGWEQAEQLVHEQYGELEELEMSQGLSRLQVDEH